MFGDTPVCMLTGLGCSLKKGRVEQTRPFLQAPTRPRLSAHKMGVKPQKEMRNQWCWQCKMPVAQVNGVFLGGSYVCAAQKKERPQKG